MGEVQRRAVLLLCFAVGIVEGFDIQIIGVAAPLMAAALALSPTDLSWIFFASNGGILIGATIGGWLADRAGRRPVLIGSAVTFGLFTLGVAFATGFAALLWLRLLAGIGLGAALPNLVATAADVATPARRGVTTGLIFCGVPLGGAIVAMASQALPPSLDWRALFVIGGSLPLLVAGLQWALLPETKPAQADAARPGVARTVFGEGRTVPSLLLWAAVAPTLMTLYLVLYWLPTLVVDKGLPMATAARASAVFNLAGVAGAIAIGVAADGRRGAATLALLYALFVVVALMLAPASDPVAVVALSGVGGFLLLGLNYAIYGLSPRIYPPAARATGSGVTVGVGRVGSIVGPIVPGFLLAGGAPAEDVLWLLAPAATVAALAVAALGLWQNRRRAGT